MRFHDLRHSHVALLIKQGTHPPVIAARLGHVSIKTVLDVYGHLSEGLDRDAADSLEPPWSDSDVHRMCTRHPEKEKHRKRPDVKKPPLTKGFVWWALLGSNQ